MTNIRELLEQSILSDCIYNENGFGETAHILKANNFITGRWINNVPLARVLWLTLEKMYPSESITPISLSMNVSSIYNVDIHADVIKLGELIHSNFNRHQYAFKILELDLKTSFMEFIKGTIDTYSDNAQVKLDLLGILEHVKKSPDIFDSISDVEKYFQSTASYIAEAEELKIFNSKIDKRITEVKRVAQCSALIKNFDNLYKFPTSRKVVIHSLLNVLKYCMLQKDIPADIEDGILKIHNKIF